MDIETIVKNAIEKLVEIEVEKQLNSYENMNLIRETVKTSISAFKQQNRDMK